MLQSREFRVLKIALDVGGVLSKYPKIFQKLLEALDPTKVEVYVVSDMHPKEEIVRALEDNDMAIKPANVYSADYHKYGEHCKAKLCESLGIHILVDDFLGYLADGQHIRLLVMPDSTKPYWSHDWKTDTQSDFGRRQNMLEVKKSYARRMDIA